MPPLVPPVCPLREEFRAIVEIDGEDDIVCPPMRTRAAAVESAERCGANALPQGVAETRIETRLVVETEWVPA